MNNNLNYNKPSGVQKLTLLEQLRKGNDIQVKFLNVKEDNALEDLQMAVFINKKLRYVTRKGAFSVKTISYQKIVRKGWRLTNEPYTYHRLVFDEEKDYQKFSNFCRQLRDCTKIIEMYHKCCRDIMESFSEECN